MVKRVRKEKIVKNKKEMEYIKREKNKGSEIKEEISNRNKLNKER